MVVISEFFLSKLNMFINKVHILDTTRVAEQLSVSFTHFCSVNLFIIKTEKNQQSEHALVRCPL